MAVFDCSEVLEKIYEYLDQESSAEDRKAIEVHLDSCQGCKAEYALELRIFSKVVTSSWQQKSTSELVEEVYLSIEAEGQA